MKLALPVWQGRLSPVFDVAGQLLVVDLADGREIARQEHLLSEVPPSARARQLSELGVQTLLCAGISQPLEEMLADGGIRVIARVCGNADEILAAFLAGQLGEARFAMPGCCGQRRRMRHQGCRHGQEQ